MSSIINKPIKEVMTSKLVTSFPDMIMVEVVRIFKDHDFHHIPVLNNQEVCVGIISKSDYHQLQNNYTRLNQKRVERDNEKFFRTLLASEVMTKDPISIDADQNVGNVLKIFLENKVHCVVVTENEKCVGIITPYDILHQINQVSYA